MGQQRDGRSAMRCGQPTDSRPRDWDNVERMLQGRIDGAYVYGVVSLHSPRKQETTIYVGSQHGFKVWLNGTLIYESLRYHASEDYTDFSRSRLSGGEMSC